MFYYKFNLKLPNHNWVGTRSCKKKYLKSPQWLRNIKVRNYPFYRLDTFFSETRYIILNLLIMEVGILLILNLQKKLELNLNRISIIENLKLILCQLKKLKI